MKSVWSNEVKIDRREKLKHDIVADVAVIGAGLAGVLIAHFLQNQGVNVVVLEANKIASGQTKNTTAKITSQHNLIYDQLISDYGEEKARQYAHANQDAIEDFRKIIQTQNISCHFEDKDAYVYTLGDCEKINKEVTAAQKLGIPAEFTQDTKLPFLVKGAVCFTGQAQFNPLEFIKAVSEPLKIYENTMVHSIEGKIIQTDRAKVTANSIVVATHFPFINTPGYYFMRMHQERSYAIALDNVPNIDGMYIDENVKGYSFRNYNNYLILGGAGHRTGENPKGKCYDELRQRAREFFPGSKEQFCWSAQDCVSLDGVPYIGKYSSSVDNLYVSTGFKKWGMTTSMVSAKIISDMILGNKNPHAEVFSPQRFKLSPAAKNLVTDSIKSVKGLGLELLLMPKSKFDEVPNGHGGVVDYEGKKVGVYKDESGKAYVVSTKCPHLGCQLEWNADELSWDCPCHGSRFDFKGKLLDNPAMECLEDRRGKV